MGKPTATPQGDVAVVGGGVIGLCVAESLTRRGADVVVLESGICGAAASAGNAGWVTPGFSSPLPAPRVMAKAIRWMFDPRGPLRISPALRPSLLRWLYAFWRNSSPSRHRAGMAALVSLSRRALADFDALAGRGVAFEICRQGLLCVSRKRSSLDGELRLLRAMQELGYGGEVRALDREQALAHEPALSSEVAGAVLAPDECHVRPETLTAGLVAHLRAQGTRLRERTAVRRISPRGDGWVLDCGEELVAADRVVLACGVQTASLLAPLGVRLPLQGAKGYSITQEDPPARPRTPVYLLDEKVAVTPYPSALRLAGTLELGSTGLGISRARIAGIERAGQRAFRDWNPVGRCTSWAGVRSALPDGLPAIGPVPGYERLHLATGHGMLGITLAPTTAEVLAPTILGGTPSAELAPFSIARFDKRGRGAVRTPTRRDNE